MNTADELITLVRQGKVRDIYRPSEWDGYSLSRPLPDDMLILVATDRISAFDVVLPADIPDKGLVLAQLAAFWFEETGDIVPNHFMRLIESVRVPEVPFELPNEFIGRAMLVHRAQRIDVECIVRGYLYGSGWSEYQATGSVSGVKLPRGLKESQELPQPIFTPTTKAEAGHDTPLTFSDVVDMVGRTAANAMRVRSLAVYQFGRDYARERGIIIADTKFEFGWYNDEIILIDECLTPDSSRLWPADKYRPGAAQPSFDKQYVRDYLTNIGWNREPPAPELPREVIERTAEKYREAFSRLTGRELVHPHS